VNKKYPLELRYNKNDVELLAPHLGLVLVVDQSESKSWLIREAFEQKKIIMILTKSIWASSQQSQQQNQGCKSYTYIVICPTALAW
jgi:hypothetical protein